jgi:hypothetical protein
MVIIVVVIAVVVVAIVVPVLAIQFGQWMRERQLRMPDEDRASARLEAQWTVIGLILAVSAAAMVFSLMRGTRYQQTSALFVGVPLILAIFTVFVPTRGSAVGIACKAVTIGLLLSLLFLGEGIICVVMAAPLFLLVAVLVGKTADKLNKDVGKDRYRMRSWVMFMAIAPMTLEGISPMTTIDRNVVVSETRIVAATPNQVASALIAQPRFERQLPFYLGIGFPRPTMTRIDGKTWVITMRGGEMKLNGLEPRAGTLILERDAEGPGFINWKAVSDDSHMRHFLSWESSQVEWTAIDAHTTLVTWTLRYRRDLDPAWYFGPMERYAVRLAAGYLIDSVATP